MAIIRTADFLDGIGVNTHMNYTDGKYANVANVIADLDYLGIDLVRDAPPKYASTAQPARDQLSAFNKMAEAGIEFNFVSSRDPYQLIADIAKFESLHPGSVEAIEGPNEINNWPLNYQGLTGTAAATAYMTDLVEAVSSSAALADVAVYGLTGAPSASNVTINAGADFGNYHGYPWAGAQPGKTVASIAAKSATEAKPIVITEIGYHTAPVHNGAAPSANAWGGVDQQTQAKLTLNLLMDAEKSGVAEIYLYQLLDAYADPTGTNIDKNIGLFDIDNKPKLAATAIHNLTNILEDNSSGASSFQIVDLAYTIENLPPEGSTLTMQKSSGVTNIILWSEPRIWDHATYTSLQAPLSHSMVNFGSNHVSVTLYDPLVSDAPIAVYSDVTSVAVTVQDHPVIVEVTDIADPQPHSVGTSLIHGSAANNVIAAGGGHDVVHGLDGADALHGGAGNDHLYGQSPNGGADGADVLYGDEGSDYLQGNAGNDTLEGGGGSDRVNGGGNDDFINGGAGNDTVNGNLGNDNILGGTGNDSLRGGRGNDTIAGGEGADLISGDMGVDWLSAGDGSDIFVFGSTSALLAGGSADIVADFEKGEDRLYIGHAVETVLTGAAYDSFSTAFAGAKRLFDDHAGLNEVAALKVGTDTFLFYGSTNGVPDSAVQLLSVNASLISTSDFLAAL